MGDDTRKRLHRLLRRDLGGVVEETTCGAWTTTSSLPHEIRLHTEAGLDLVRVSAAMVIGTKPSKALFSTINELNTYHAFSRRIVIDDKVLIVAEMPVASLRKGDLEQLASMVFCLARLDAPGLALHGGRSVTDPPPALAPDFASVLTSWEDVLRASGTATERELAVWLDDLVGGDFWIDRDDTSLIVVPMGGDGTGSEYPFTLGELRETAADLVDELEDDE